jgi:hypothetical protein
MRPNFAQLRILRRCYDVCTSKILFALLHQINQPKLLQVAINITTDKDVHSNIFLSFLVDKLMLYIATGSRTCTIFLVIWCQRLDKDIMSCNVTTLKGLKNVGQQICDIYYIIGHNGRVYNMHVILLFRLVSRGHYRKCFDCWCSRYLKFGNVVYYFYRYNSPMNYVICF